MTAWSLAFRNVWRNARRSVSTMLAIALSCAGLMLFGGYITWAHLAAEVHAVVLSGHLQIFKAGYQAKGSGNPAAYALTGYDEIKKMLLGDPVIGPRIDLITGRLVVSGIVTSAEQQTTATFAGMGAFPGEIERIIYWNPYGLTEARHIPANRHLFAREPELDASDPDGITIGEGLARVLGVNGSARPSLELTALPPSGGLPNMVSGTVRQTSIRAMEELDNHLVVMPIEMASGLLFPGEPLHVTSVQLLLKSTEDLPLVEQRIDELAREHHLEWEHRDCWELNPNHARSLSMVNMFFAFAFCIVAVVLVFTIYNTMMMGIVERTREIGAMRAMGVTRAGIVTMFVQEGIVLGLLGGCAGIVAGLVTAWAVNHSMILYTPPYFNVQAKLEVACLHSPMIVTGSFLSSFCVAVIGALFPARRASRLEIAEALRH
ncbi:MAG: ABC transporter permease [Verrucomicrobiaceae bacterium]|nr:ABC transporter permease [Verrucomicrobiaceae bacterium]